MIILQLYTSDVLEHKMASEPKNYIISASKASEADYQSCSIEILDIYTYVCLRTSKIFARVSNYVS